MTAENRGMENRKTQDNAGPTTLLRRTHHGRTRFSALMPPVDRHGGAHPTLVLRAPDPTDSGKRQKALVAPESAVQAPDEGERD